MTTIIGIAVVALIVVGGIIIVRRRNQQNRTARLSSRLGITPDPSDPDADPPSDPFGVPPPRRAAAPRPGHAGPPCDDEEHDVHEEEHGQHAHPDSAFPDAIFAGIVVGTFFSSVQSWGWLVGMLAAGWVFALTKLTGTWRNAIGLIGFLGIFDQILGQNTDLGAGYLTNLVKLVGQIGVDMVKVPFQELEGHWGTVSLVITIFAAWNLRGWLIGIDWKGIPEALIRKGGMWFRDQGKGQWINSLIAGLISAVLAWLIVGYVESLLK